MKIKKLTFLLFSFVALNGCVESTAALFGPAITVGTSGNIYQASLSYASNQIIYETTGKMTIDHVADFLDPTDEFEGDLNLILKDNIEDFKKILQKPEEKLVSEDKKKSEPFLDSVLEDQFILF